MQQVGIFIHKGDGREDAAGLIFRVGNNLTQPQFSFLNIGSIHRGLLEIELDGACRGISVRRAGLSQSVHFAQILVVIGSIALVEVEPADNVAGVTGLPAVHNVAIPVGDGQCGTGQRKGGFRIQRGKRLFVDIDLGLFVRVEAIHHLPGDHLVLVGELHGDRRLLNQVTVRYGDLTDIVPATVGSPVVGVATAIMFTADGNVYVEIGKAILTGGGSSQQRVSSGQERTVHAVDVISGVQLIGRAGNQNCTLGDTITVAAARQQGRVRFHAIHIRMVVGHARGITVELVDTHADAAFFHHRDNTGIFKLDGAGLPGELVAGGIRGVEDIIAVDLIAILGMVHNGLGQDNVIVLVIPAKGYGIGLVGMYEAIGRLYLGNIIGAKGQGDGDLSGGAVVADRQKIVGGLGAGGTEFDFVHLTFSARGDSSNQITVGIPQRALTISGGDISVGTDLIDGVRQIGLLIQELTIFITGQQIADLTDGELSQGLVVAVFLGQNIVIHVIGTAAHNFPDALRSQLKDHIIGCVVEKAFRALYLDDPITTKRQLFRGLEIAVCIGIEGGGFGGSVTGIGIVHLHQRFSAILGNLVDLERRVGDLDRFAGFSIDLDQLQVALQFFIQNAVGHVAVAGGGRGAIRLAKNTLRSRSVHRDYKRIRLE